MGFKTVVNEAPKKSTAEELGKNPCGCDPRGCACPGMSRVVEVPDVAEKPKAKAPKPKVKAPVAKKAPKNVPEAVKGKEMGPVVTSGAPAAPAVSGEPGDDDKINFDA